MCIGDEGCEVCALLTIYLLLLWDAVKALDDIDTHSLHICKHHTLSQTIQPSMDTPTCTHTSITSALHLFG